jgi:hypothetical protein
MLGHEGLAGQFILGEDLPESFPALNKLRHGVGRSQQLGGPERAGLVQGDQPSGHGCFTDPDAAGKILDRRRGTGDVLLEFGQFGLECGRAPAVTLQGEAGGLQRTGVASSRATRATGFLLLDVLPQRVTSAQASMARPRAAFR